MLKKILIIVLLLIAIPFILFLFTPPKRSIPGVIPSASPKALPAISPTIDPNNFDYSPVYKEKITPINQQQDAALQQDALVSKFIDTLPYTGTTITVSYTISNNNIVVTLQREKETQGNQEFDDLLRKNGIQSRTWIKDLQVQ